MLGETVGTIKDVLYVRFSVTDLQVQQQFLEDFGFKSETVSYTHLTLPTKRIV